MTVSPAPVPVRPLISDLAETGLFGGIAHGSRGGPTRGAGDAVLPADDPATAAPSTPGHTKAAGRPAEPREASAREATARETAATAGREATARETTAREATARETTVLIVDGRPRRVRLERIDTEHAILEVDTGRSDESAADGASTASPDGDTSTAEGPTRVRVLLGRDDRRRADGVVGQEVVVDGWRFELELESERRAALRDRARRGHEAAGHAGPMEIHAIIPGRIVAISVSPGEAVEAGQQLLVEEAMKMQNELRAPREGEIERIAVTVGQTVDVGDLLMVIS